MKLNEKIRKYWHDVYYFFAKEKGIKFALTCQDVAHQVDVGVSKSLIGRFRFYLHLSLCQGCKNYSKLTNALGVAIRTVVSANEKPDRMEQLNKDLLAKHSTGITSKQE